jgi:hypothetical protein
VLGSTSGGVLGVDVEFDDFPRDWRLYTESQSGPSEPS